MPTLELNVEVFDPALPFEMVSVPNPGVDTWHRFSLIAKELRSKLSHVQDAGFETLDLSGGMSMRVPYVEIGVRVGTIKIEQIPVLVVDEGYHGLLLGSELISRAFAVGEDESSGVSVSSSRKEDPTALSIELYPLQMPFDLRLLEVFLRQERRLYNILLIAEQNVQFEDPSDLEDAIENDDRLKSEFRLQLSAIDAGSIWLSLKSGATSTLKRLAAIFETSASAKLAQQMAEAKKAETEASISADIRDATAARQRAEQIMLQSENIRKTYETWRKEVRSRVKFFDELIGQVHDEDTRRLLIAQKDDAIRTLTDQEIVPMVRNIPRPFESLDGVFRLPRPPVEPRGQ